MTSIVNIFSDIKIRRKSCNRRRQFTTKRPTYYGLMLGTTDSGQILKLKWGIIKAPPNIRVEEITEYFVYNLYSISLLSTLGVGNITLDVGLCWLLRCWGVINIISQQQWTVLTVRESQTFFPGPTQSTENPMILSDFKWRPTTPPSLIETRNI